MRLLIVGLALVLASCGGGGDEKPGPEILLDRTTTATGVMGIQRDGVSYSTLATIDGPAFTVALSGTLTACFDVQWSQQLRRATNVELSLSMAQPAAGPSRRVTAAGVVGANALTARLCAEFPALAGTQTTRINATVFAECGSACPDSLADYSATIRWTASVQ